MTSIAHYAETHKLSAKETERLKSLDVDGDGTIDENEVMASAVAQGEAATKIVWLEHALALVVFFFFLSLAAMLGVSILANQLSKETEMVGADMKTPSGELVNVNQKVTTVSLYDYVDFTMAQLSTVQKVSFSAGTSDTIMSVTRIDKGNDASVTFFSPGNDKLQVTKTQMTWTPQGGTAVVMPKDAVNGSRRRLMQVGGGATGLYTGEPVSGSTGTVVATIDLKTADNYVILTKTGVTTTGTTKITGNMGTSPIAATAMTGFGLVLDTSGQFSTSSLVTGEITAASYVAPTPATLTVAVLDMQAAYVESQGRPFPDAVELAGGLLSGKTLTAGIYKFSTGVSFKDLTLHGSSTDVFIFQIAGVLAVASYGTVTLTGGLQAHNVFWSVAGNAAIGTYSQFQGVILCMTYVACQTGASIYGQVLAQTAHTIDACKITKAVPQKPEPNNADQFEGIDMSELPEGFVIPEGYGDDGFGGLMR